MKSLTENDLHMYGSEQMQNMNSTRVRETKPLSKSVKPKYKQPTLIGDLLVHREVYFEGIEGV